MVVGIITAWLKSLSYEVKLEDGRKLHCYQDHIRRCKDMHTETESNWTDSIQSPTQPLLNVTQHTQESSTKEPVCHYPLQRNLDPRQI